LPHQKSKQKSIVTSHKNLKEIIFTIEQSLLSWKNQKIFSWRGSSEMLTTGQKKVITKELQVDYNKQAKKVKDELMYFIF